jgi:hypothetical protein
MLELTFLNRENLDLIKMFMESVAKFEVLQSNFAGYNFSTIIGQF